MRVEWLHAASIYPRVIPRGADVITADGAAVMDRGTVGVALIPSHADDGAVLAGTVEEVRATLRAALASLDLAVARGDVPFS